jgi:hypothetical protein
MGLRFEADRRSPDTEANARFVSCREESFNVQRFRGWKFLRAFAGSSSQQPGWKGIGSRSREGLRSSGTAKFNARYDDFFSARAYLHQEAIFSIE